MMTHGTRRTKTRLYITICILILAFLVFDKMRENRAKLDQEGKSDKVAIATLIKSMPQWDLHDLEGNKVTSEFLKGNIVLINFWSIDCEPCLAEVSVLKDLQAKYADKGFKIVAIVLDVREDDDLEGFVKGEKINYIVLRGDADVVDKFAHVKEVPESFLFDRNGDLIYYNLGKLDETQVNALIESSL